MSRSRNEVVTCSCSLRGLQPLKRIVCRKRGLCGDCPWVVSLPPRPRDSVTDRLRRQVEGMLAAEAVQVAVHAGSQPLDKCDV